MINYKNLFDYFRQCPYLKNLKTIAGDSSQGNQVILPNGSGEMFQNNESTDTTGWYENDRKPYPSTYEDFQINCYEFYDVNETNPPQYNVNALTYEEVCSVCEWIDEQDGKENFPDVGEKVVSIECYPFVPQIQYVDPDTNTVGYYITIRIRYVNRKKRRYIEYGP